MSTKHGRVGTGWWWVAALAAAGLAGCAAENTPEACAVRPVAEVALQMIGNRPMVDVLIEGRKARLLLDTGASGVALSEPAFERLGLRYNLGITATVTGLGARTLQRVSEPVTITIGSTKLEPINALVIGSSTDLSSASQFDGLLGTRALAAYDVDIDLPQHRLGLNEARHCPTGPPPFAGPSITLQAPANPLLWFFVPLQADGTTYSALVDTGASGTVLNAARAGLQRDALEQDRAVRVRTVDAAGTTVRIHRFDRVQVGDEVFDRATLAVGRLPAGMDAVLGSDFWRRRRVWLSFASWTITFQRRTGGEASASPGR